MNDLDPAVRRALDRIANRTPPTPAPAAIEPIPNQLDLFPEETT